MQLGPVYRSPASEHATKNSCFDDAKYTTEYSTIPQVAICALWFWLFIIAKTLAYYAVCSTDYLTSASWAGPFTVFSYARSTEACSQQFSYPVRLQQWGPAEQPFGEPREAVLLALLELDWTNHSRCAPTETEIMHIYHENEWPSISGHHQCKDTIDGEIPLPAV